MNTASYSTCDSSKTDMLRGGSCWETFQVNRHRSSSSELFPFLGTGIGCSRLSRQEPELSFPPAHPFFSGTTFAKSVLISHRQCCTILMETQTSALLPFTA